MIGRRDPAPAALAPWRGVALHATAERRRRVLRTSMHVDLVAGDVSATFAAGDLVRLVDGGASVAESVGGPLAFLCTSASAAPDSALAPLLAAVEPDALALVAEPMDHVAATIVGAQRDGFAAWVRALPR